MMEVKQNPFGWLLLTTLILLESKLALGECDGTEITLLVDVNFRQQDLDSVEQYESVVDISSGFEAKMDSLAVSGTISFGNDLFGGSASAAVEEVSDVSDEWNTYSENTEHSVITFNTNFTQIRREVTTTVLIDGSISKTVEEDYVDSVPDTELLTTDQLKEREDHYIERRFGDSKGTISGSSYEETVCQDAQATRICNGNLYTVRVSYEYFQQALAHAAETTKTVESSSYFNSVYNSLDTSASISGDYGGFSASIEAEYATVIESVTSSSSYRETNSFDVRDYDTDNVQIIEVIKTAVTINGRTAKTDIRHYETAVKGEELKSSDELEKMAEDKIEEMYGDGGGTIYKNTYTESVCETCDDGVQNQDETDVDCGGSCNPCGDFLAMDGCSTNEYSSPQYLNGVERLAKVQCCSDDGTSCVRKNPDSGACFSNDYGEQKVTLWEADDICTSNGMRLCYSQEELDLCCGSGCEYDTQPIWTKAVELGYTYYHSRACIGMNEIFKGTVDNRQECRSKCDDNDGCVSFEWWGESNAHYSKGSNYCQVSSSCTNYLSVDTTSLDLADLYVKEGMSYTQYDYRGCSEMNELYEGTLSEQLECQWKCADNEDCVSFEWNSGTSKCQLSSSCNYALSEAFTDWTLYVKDD